MTNLRNVLNKRKICNFIFKVYCIRVEASDECLIVNKDFFHIKGLLINTNDKINSVAVAKNVYGVKHNKDWLGNN